MSLYHNTVACTAVARRLQKLDDNYGNGVFSMWSVPRYSKQDKTEAAKQLLSEVVSSQLRESSVLV
jgi:hypothetical protein